MSEPRISALGYSVDSVRQTYTGYEKDSETDLAFAQARYYSPLFGRFYSVDPSATSARKLNPQTLNRYVYVLNDPLDLRDPSGLSVESCGHQGEEGCNKKKKNDLGEFDVVVNGSTKHRPWYKRMFGWIARHITSGGTSQQIDDELFPERSEAEREAKEIDNAFGDPAVNEPPVRSPAEQEFYERDFWRREKLAEDLGLPCYQMEPEPTGDVETEETVHDSNTLQSGGNTLRPATLRALGLTQEQGKRAVESMKAFLGLRNDDHFKIMRNGDIVDPNTKQAIGNIYQFIP